MTNKQRRALRREKARERSQKRRVQRTVAVNMQAVRAGTHTAAREAVPRFEVDATLTWYVIRTLPRWANRAAEQIRGLGTPVFEAREAVRLVSEVGKVRVALIPVLRRLLFVGVRDWRELKAAEEQPGVYDDATGYRRSGVVERPGGGVMTIAPADLQNFADCITGFGGDMDAAKAVLFAIGETVRVCDGPFVSFNGTVEEIDIRTGRMKVAVDLFGRATPVELERNQVEAA